MSLTGENIWTIVREERKREEKSCERDNGSTRLFFLSLGFLRVLGFFLCRCCL